MFWTNSKILTAFTLAAVAVANPLAHAADPFKRSDFQLDEGDLALLKTAAGRLYLMDGVEVGSVETWNNPETGNHGTVRLIGKPEYKGLPCRRLQHDIELKRVTHPYRFTFDRCRIDSGEWKIVTQ